MESELTVHGYELGAREGAYAPVRIVTDRSRVLGRLYQAPSAARGAIWVGGVGGGWDSPALDLYPRLSAALVEEAVTSLRIQFREPGDLAESVLDVLAGLHVLETQGIREVALIGHSFGGAVVIQAAAAAPEVYAVVGIASQAYGADPAAELGPRCSLLLLHGTGDPVLPPVCSQEIHRIAREPKRLVLYPGAGHCLDEVADQVEAEVRAWLMK